MQEEHTQHTKTLQDSLTQHVPVQLSAAERKQMNRTAVQGLLHIVLAQSVLLLAVGFISWWVAGQWAMLSAFLGGLSYLLPSAIYTIHILLKIHAKQDATAFTFFIGEAFKLLTTLALLAVVVKLMGVYLVWPALLFGLLVVLKAYVLLLIFKKL